MCERHCLPQIAQIAQITQRNTTSCIITQRKTGCLRLRLCCCLLFVVCCLSAIICEICGRHWGLVCADCLSTLTWLFSRRLRRLRRGIQQVVLFRRERQVGDGCEIIAVIVVLLFWVLSAIICEICGRLWGFY